MSVYCGSVAIIVIFTRTCINRSHSFGPTKSLRNRAIIAQGWFNNDRRCRSVTKSTTHTHITHARLAARPALIFKHSFRGINGKTRYTKIREHALNLCANVDRNPNRPYRISNVCTISYVRTLAISVYMGVVCA